MWGYNVIMYYVYILKNTEGEKYIGVTHDLKTRFAQHNDGKTRTTKGSLHKIVWYCAFPNKEKAYDFEKYLKSSSGYAFANKHLL